MSCVTRPKYSNKRIDKRTREKKRRRGQDADTQSRSTQTTQPHTRDPEKGGGVPPHKNTKPKAGGAGATPSLRQGRPEAYRTLTPEGNPLRRGGVRKYLPGTNEN